MENNIITEKDINRLLKFADKNMGSYLLFYSKRKKQYYLLILAAIIICILCLVCFYTVYENISIANFIILLTLCFVIYTSWRFVELYRKYLNMEPVIQRKRLEVLEQYYLEQNFKEYDLLCVLRLLERKVKPKNNLGITFLMGTLLFPIWENYMSFLFENALENVKLIEMIGYILIRMVILIIIIGSIWKLAIFIDYILRYRSRKIENIIYITEHILYDKYNIQR